MAGGEYGGLLIALGILLTIGFIVPLFIQPFVPEGTYNPDSIASPLIQFVDEGFTIDLPIINEVSINVFGLFGTGFKDFMVSQVEAFTYIPNSVSIPLLVISFLLLGYSIIKLIP